MPSRLLDTLDEAEQRQVLAVARRRRFKRNEVVFHDGDPGDTLHLIIRGYFAIRITTPEGNQAMIRVFGPGDFFGELAMLSPGQRRGSAVSLEEGETLSLHREDFQILRTTIPRINDVLTGPVVIPLTQDHIAQLAGTTRPTANRVLRMCEEDGLLSLARARIEVHDPSSLRRRAHKNQ